jgi:hypothetical protein
MTLPAGHRVLPEHQDGRLQRLMGLKNESHFPLKYYTSAYAGCMRIKICAAQKCIWQVSGPGPDPESYTYGKRLSSVPVPTRASGRKNQILDDHHQILSMAGGRPDAIISRSGTRCQPDACATHCICIKHWLMICRLKLGDGHCVACPMQTADLPHHQLTSTPTGMLKLKCVQHTTSRSTYDGREELRPAYVNT